MGALEVPIASSSRDAPTIENVTTARIRELLPGIDVLLVTTTLVERDAVLQVLQPLPQESALLEGNVGRITVRIGQFGRYYAAHVECTMGSVGRDASQLSVFEAIEEVDPKAVLVLGIAFGCNPAKQQLGDVIVAQSVVPYERARVGARVVPRGAPEPAGQILFDRFRARSFDWVERRGDERVQVLCGPLLSGEKLIDDQSFRDGLREAFPDAIGGEMEGSGAYGAAARAKVEILLVKAISDFADGEKAATRDMQPFAASMAVSLAWHVLDKPNVLLALGARDREVTKERNGNTGGSSSPRQRLLEGIDLLGVDWANRIGGFIDAYSGTAERPNVFCGREDDVDRVEAWLDAKCDPANLLVTAPAGRGKSALLVRFALRLAERTDTNVVFIPASLRFGTHRPDVLLGCLVARLASLHGRNPPDLKHLTVDMLRKMLLDELSQAPAEGRRTVVMLDGFDEAGSLGDIPWLLPPHHADSTRILVSARELPDDPSGDRWLRALGWEGPGVAKRLTLAPLDAGDVKATLRRLPAPLDRLAQRHDLVAELLRLCTGEPLTLWLMMGEIVGLGEAAVDLDVSSLRERAPGLAGWFELWWQQQRKQWGDAAHHRERAVRALLDVVSVAEGGLTRDDLLSLLHEEIPDGSSLDEALEKLSRLIHGDGKRSGYVPAHPGFGQYIREQLGKTAVKQWRRRIAKWAQSFVDDLLAGRASGDEVPRYVVQHFPAHLQEERAAPERWMSLVTRAWYDAWRAPEEGPSGFLEGVARSWKAVAADGEHLAEEAQCALVKGSVGSTLAQVTPGLLKMLLDERIWPPEQAFAYARTAPVVEHSDGKRAKLLEVLAPRIPDALLPQFFEIACGLEGVHFASLARGVFEDLLRRMAVVAPMEARIALEKIKSPGTRALHLCTLARYLPMDEQSPVLSYALSLARRIERPESRAYVLKRVGEAMTGPAREQALRDAFDAAREVTETKQRCYTLADIAAALPVKILDHACAEALDAASRLAMNDRVYALNSLVDDLPSPHCMDAWRAFEAAIDANEDLAGAAHMYLGRLSSLPEDERGGCIDKVFELIDRIPDEMTRARATMAILMNEAVRKETPSIRQAIAERALRVARRIEQPWTRLHIVDQLHRDVSAELCWQCVEPTWPVIVASLRANEPRDDLYATFRIAPLAMALDAARQTLFPWSRAQLLVTVAYRIPDEAERWPVLEDAIEATQQVVLPRNRADLYMQIFCAAPEHAQNAVFEALILAIDEITDPYWQTRTLVDLAHMLAEPWRTRAFEAAHEAALAIEMPHARFDELLRIAKHVGKERREVVLNDALETARRELATAMRLRHLTNLAAEVDGPCRRELLRMALKWSQTIGDESRCVQTMIAYAAHLPPDEIDAIARCIDRIEEPGAKVDAYVELLSRCPAERTSRFGAALAAARVFSRAPGLHTRNLQLAKLVRVAPEPLLSELLRETLDAAATDLESIERPPSGALLEDYYADTSGSMFDREIEQAFLQLIPFLPGAWIPEALAIAERIATIYVRANVLVWLAWRLGDAERMQIAERILTAELPRIRHLDPTEMRSQIARTVAPLLPEPRRSEVLAAFPSPSTASPEVEGMMGRGKAGLERFPRIAPELSTQELDEALAQVEADRSHGSPHDARLEALAALASERLRRPHPPRQRLQKILHDTLHGRAETRAEVLLVLSAMAPLVVGLGGTPAAVGVVRAIRRVGEWWP